MQMPPMGPVGAASVQSGNPGLAAKALTQVGEAIRILEMALPNVPPGTPVHKDTLDCIQKLSKHVPAGDQTHGVQMTALADLQRNAQQSAMLQQVMRQSGQGAAAGGAAQGGGMPGMPPGGGMAA
jgi:hypothetical protein